MHLANHLLLYCPKNVYKGILSTKYENARDSNGILKKKTEILWVMDIHFREGICEKVER